MRKGGAKIKLTNNRDRAALLCKRVMTFAIIVSFALCGFVSPAYAYNETYTVKEAYEWVWEYEEHWYYKMNSWDTDSFIPTGDGNWSGSNHQSDPVQVKQKVVSTNYSRQQMIDMLKCDVAYWVKHDSYQTPGASIPCSIFKAIKSSTVKLKETKYKDVQKTRWVNETIRFKDAIGRVYFSVICDKSEGVLLTTVSQASQVYKEGYTVKEWFDEINNKVYPLGSTVYADANNKNGRTLVPRYDANTYTVTFDGNGSTEGAMAPQAMTYDQDSALNPNEYVRTGYTFAGWENGNDVYQDGESVKNLTSQQGGNVTLKAKWNINSYDVTFLDYDGTELKKESVNYGSQATAPEDLKRTGYTFEKWDKDFDNITEDTVVTAQYLPNEYSVKYDTTGGSDIADKTEVKWEDKDLVPEEIPVKAGFEFIGWQYDGKDVTSEDAYSMLASDDTDGTSITLTANWNELKDYNVVFDTAGGKLPNGAISNINGIAYNDKIDMPTPTKDGYVFAGWTYDGKEIEDATYGEIAGDDTVKEITLVAKWNVEEKNNGINGSTGNRAPGSSNSSSLNGNGNSSNTADKASGNGLSNGSGKNNTTKTGDNSAVGMMTLILIASGTGAYTVYRRSRKSS